MIQYKNKTINRLVDWLNIKYPKLPTVSLVVMNGFQYIQVRDGFGFGVYQTGENPVIMIAGDAPEEFATPEEQEDFFATTFLHEFRHHMQHVMGDDLERLSCDDEEDAEMWADMAWEAMKPAGRK